MSLRIKAVTEMKCEESEAHETVFVGSGGWCGREGDDAVR